MTSSLEILCPSLLEGPAPSADAPGVPAEWHETLKQLTLDLVNAANNRTFEEVAKRCFAPDFVANIDFSSPHPWTELSRAETIALIQQQVEAGDAGQEARIVNLSVDFSRNMAAACTWLEMENTGYPKPHLRTTGLSVFKWRRRHGTWQCYRHTHLKYLCDQVLEKQPEMPLEQGTSAGPEAPKHRRGGFKGLK